MSAVSQAPQHSNSPPDGVPALQFFEQVQAAFEKAAGASIFAGERFFRVGGLIVCLRFAGETLAARLTPALEHLSTPPCSAPDLTICLWDTAATGVEAPSPPWTHEDFDVRNEIRGYNDERIRTAYHLGSGVLSVLDAQRNLGVFWVRDARELAVWECGSPLLHLFSWWFNAHNRQLLHAAAVGYQDGGVLLVGKGGSGKSSTALQTLDSPLSYVADDYCLLSLDPLPFVHSLYSSGKVCGHDTETFPFLKPALVNAPRLSNEKALFFLKDHFPDKISAGFPIKAVVLPRVTGKPSTRIVKAAPSACLLALAPSTIFQLPGAGQPTFQMLSDLVRRVPGYVLELGTEREQIPVAIADLLKSLQKK